MKWVLGIFCLPLGVGCAFAADMTVTVTDENGAPVSGALVWSDGSPSGAATATPPTPMAMAQENKSFAPYVLAVPTGAKVEFPNRDRFRHHVYSFSKGNSFELELYGREEKRFVSFDTPGVVAVGCNIHDNMIGYIRVMDTPGVIYTNENGVALIAVDDASPGTLNVWHPNGNEGRLWEGNPDGASVAVTLTMDEAFASAASASE